MVVPEEVLAGGNLSPVVRVGDTVRRRAGSWTPTVHLLLKHLEQHGFDGAPRVVGFDEQGREMLTYLEGATNHSGDPEWVWSERALVGTAQFICRYHDVCRTFEPPASARWQVMVGAPTSGEIVCHNDLAPFNAVFQDGVPVAFLDWDLAAPAPPLWDVAYAAWRFVPLYDDPAERGWTTDVVARASRLRLLSDAYGLSDRERAQLVPTVERRIRCSFETLEAWGQEGKLGWSEMWRARTHGEGMLRDLAYVAEHRDALRRALG